MLNFANILDVIAGWKYYGNWTKNDKNDHVRSHSEVQKQGKSIHFDPSFLESHSLRSYTKKVDFCQQVNLFLLLCHLILDVEQ